ncbi:MAG: sulfurtransferase [Verrucomicrobia bacterium]|nr:sulfurtransferase [Verrucomicrobiota bacterium]
MAECEFPGSLVSVEWLHQHLDGDDVIVLDASWHLPGKERCGREEWQDLHIPGALFFDYDGEIKNQQIDLPRMLPPEDLFTESVRKLGVNEDSLIVVYDSNAMFSSPRAWWMFRAMGHERVAVLDGGLLAWQEAGYAVNDEPRDLPVPGNFVAVKNERFVNADYVTSRLHDAHTTILDARSTDRFEAGCMPGAKNLPYVELLEEGKMKPIDELESIFSALAEPDQSLLCSCGSGVTACIIALAADISGRNEVVVYDASWTEWGAESSGFPVEVSS